MRPLPERTVSVEAPGPAGLDEFKPGFVVTVQQLIGDLAGRRLVGQLERFRAEPLDADYRDKAVGQDAAHGSVDVEVFQFHGFHHDQIGCDVNFLTRLGAKPQPCQTG